jgi:hypothetical protein
MPLPKSRTKLLKLFEKIEDDTIRNIIANVISLENEYRSSLQTNTHIKKVISIIEKEADFLELSERLKTTSRKCSILK